MPLHLRQFITARAIARPLRTPEWHATTHLYPPVSRFILAANAPTPRTHPHRTPSAPCNPPPRAYSTWEEDYPLTLVSEDGSMASATTAPSATSSGKRKRAMPPAFYAVKTGRVPGIYQSWDETSQNVLGFDHPVYRKFDTLAQAEAFMKDTPKSGKGKFYGVAVGLVPGVYTDWSSVQAQTKGFKGAKHKSFTTREEAQDFVDGVKRGSSAPISLRGDLSETSSLATSNMDKTGDPTPKKQKKENAPTTALTNGDIKPEPGYAPLPPDAVDGFDPTLKMDPETGNIRVKTEEEASATKIHPTGDFSGPIVVHTDGSALGNGRLGAVAGVGVYFGPSDKRNVAEPLRGDRQTNQRAELVAIARALDHVPIDRSAKIITDSNYSIKCLTEWCFKWEKNGWKNAAGKQVENKELIEPILARIRERDMCRATTKFEWVKGHNNDPGNVAADLCAVEGSRKSTPELRAGRPHDVSLTLRTPTRSHQALQNHFKPKAEPAPEEDMDEDNIDDIFADLAAEQAVNEARNATLEPMVGSAAPVESLGDVAVELAREQEQTDSIDMKVDGVDAKEKEM